MAGRVFSKIFSGPSFEPGIVLENQSVEVVFSEKIEKGVDFNNALDGLVNIPISPHFKREVEEDLRLPVHRTLFKLTNPTILVFTWPNGETRHFVLTQEGRLLEKNDFWLKYFHFIARDGNGFRINGNISVNGVLKSPESFYWSPDMANFSHFLVDALAPCVDFSKQFEFLKNLPIPQFSKMPAWQDEYFTDLGERKLLQGSIGSFVVFQPGELYFPVISGTLERTLAIGAYFRSQGKIPYLPITKRRPIFLTRRDARSARIRNAHEIASLVMKRGGLCVDPSQYGIRKKRELFSMNAVFLCEGSGNTNVAVFGTPESRVISLMDITPTLNPAFIQGGWPYYHSISARTDFICGSDSVPLPGSPLSSCHYSIEQINNKIEQYCY